MIEIPAGAGPVFGLVSLALVALWMPWRASFLGAAAGRFPGGPLWLPLAIAALGLALQHDFVTPRGALALTALGFATHFAHRRSSLPSERRVATGVTIALGAALMAHWVPGFDNPQVLDEVVLSAEAAAYSKYLNLDKAMAGLVLLALAGWPLARAAEWRRILAAVARVVPPTAAALLGLAWLLGYVAWDPLADSGRRSLLLFWCWTNLLFTCAAEEALFRGVIQRKLAAALSGRRHGALIALAVAALLFGLAHSAGGWRYVLLSTVAGGGYGWALLRSGRIEASILTHFLVNLLHFALFTYPALAPG